MDILSQTYLADILHIIAQALLLPTVAALIGLILYALWCVGSFAVEWVREHRYFTVVMPRFMDDMVSATDAELYGTVCDSGLLGSQKRALLTLWDYRCLPTDAHVALAKRLLNEENNARTRVLSRTQTVSKIAPMLGLMGTLIPLGPGLVSLGVGDTLTLSSSLLVAFDTTVAGLVVALVTFVVTKVRSRWYDNYMSALEAGAIALLEKVDAARESGAALPDAPTDCAQQFAVYTGKDMRRDRKAQKARAKTQAKAQEQMKVQAHGKTQDEEQTPQPEQAPQPESTPAWAQEYASASEGVFVQTHTEGNEERVAQ